MEKNIYVYIYTYIYMCVRIFIGLLWWLSGKEYACNAGYAGTIPGSGRSPEKEMATHSSILASQKGGLKLNIQKTKMHDI